MFEDLCVVVGRALIGGVFIWDAVDKMMNRTQILALFKKMKVPRPDLYLPVSAGLKAVGGLSILFGFFIAVGSALLLLVKIPTLFVFHSFWKLQGAERNAMKREFMKELIIIGSLLFMLAVGLGY